MLQTGLRTKLGAPASPRACGACPFACALRRAQDKPGVSRVGGMVYGGPVGLEWVFAGLGLVTKW